MSAAETGHLVLSTLHSSSAPQAVTRILDFFPPESREQARKQMALCLRAIICQILVPAASGAGVFPAHEIMLNNSTVRKMLEENKLDRLGAAVETGREEGMITFNQSLLALCKSGKITEPVALDFAPNPESLKMNLKGIFLSDDNRILG
ncbi:MAG: ATPase, T2SS/T4P/T4SS family, partial [Verrucomicrobiae bacterium]|nr:ATPase, T2SS/T4P/T4SS family [Verrucomicrobiae bacterium]